MSVLLTDNASPGSSDGMMPGFPVEEGGGGMENMVIVAISLILLFFIDGPETRDGTFCFYEYFSNLGRKCIMSEDGAVSLVSAPILEINPPKSTTGKNLILADLFMFVSWIDRMWHSTKDGCRMTQCCISVRCICNW